MHSFVCAFALPFVPRFNAFCPQLRPLGQGSTCVMTSVLIGTTASSAVSASKVATSAGEAIFFLHVGEVDLLLSLCLELCSLMFNTQFR
jgi:hypothetical protein